MTFVQECFSDNPNNTSQNSSMLVNNSENAHNHNFPVSVCSGIKVPITLRKASKTKPSISPSSSPSSPTKYEISASSNLKSVKKSVACASCHKSHVSCDGSRPCKRCVKKNISSECSDPIKIPAVAPKRLSTATNLNILPAPPKPYTRPFTIPLEGGNKENGPFCSMPEICNTLQSNPIPIFTSYSPPETQIIVPSISFLETSHGLVSLVQSEDGIISVIPSTNSFISRNEIPNIESTSHTQVTPLMMEARQNETIGRFWKQPPNIFDNPFPPISSTSDHHLQSFSESIHNDKDANGLSASMSETLVDLKRPSCFLENDGVLDDRLSCFSYLFDSAFSELGQRNDSKFSEDIESISSLRSCAKARKLSRCSNCPLNKLRKRGI